MANESEIEVKIKIKVECSECGEELVLESKDSWSPNEFKTNPCDSCIASAAELAEEKGYERGKEEGLEEGQKDSQN